MKFRFRPAAFLLLPICNLVNLSKSATASGPGTLLVVAADHDQPADQ